MFTFPLALQLSMLLALHPFPQFIKKKKKKKKKEKPFYGFMHEEHVTVLCSVSRKRDYN